MRRNAERASAVPQFVLPLLICALVSPLAGQGTRAKNVRELAKGKFDAIATQL